MRDTRASILKAGGQLFGADGGDGAGEFVQHQLHPELAGLVLDDEQHFVAVRRARMLGGEDGVEGEVVGVGQVLGEIQLCGVPFRV